MIHLQNLPPNQAAYLRLKPLIDQTYPAGHFVAIDEGEIVGDAPSFEELDAALNASGRTSRAILVVQAGVTLPDFSWIF
jgi:hypothetical protein